ncbi:MAG TPA: EAL domain-containing protein [Pseudolabrys sp.]|jgi:sensor c-di-GMP phosphodiesterase-like protein|nr:EAL domain-containing protein [Pseudolabrys sp.]
MGFFVRAFSRRNIFAIVVGVLLAGIPLIAFNFWLEDLIEKQGEAEVGTSARRAIALAEARVRDAIGALDSLTARGVASCGPSEIEAMRYAAFHTIPVKEMAVVGPDAETLCTHLGLPLGERVMVSSELLVGAVGYSLDIIILPGSERMVRLRRQVGAGPNGVAALVPTTLFLPQVSTQGNPFNAYARIITRQGTVIGEIGERPTGDRGPNFVAQTKSDKFGFDVEILTPRARIAARQADLRWFGWLGALTVLMAITGYVVFVPRRTPPNPVIEIEQALRAGEFVPYYQPVVDISSGKLRGAEVLARWRKPDGTLVLPGAFIPLMESSGLIRDLTRNLMRAVCAEAGPAVSRRPDLKISFNFAGKLFSERTIVNDVRNIFANSPIKFSQVVLEVTERDPIENFTETRQIIAALQGLGVRIAIDDVGTGHSGLSYMLKLGVDIIKIDKMFVDAIGTDRNSTTIVETLVDLARNMRMDVVAEGVENFEQVMHLRALGVRSAQGYAFAPPLPGSSFLQLVEAIDPLQPAAAESVSMSA